MEVVSKTKNARTQNKGMTRVQLIQEVEMLNDNLSALRNINMSQGRKIREMSLRLKELSVISNKKYSFFSFRKNLRILNTLKSILNE